MSISEAAAVAKTMLNVAPFWSTRPELHESKSAHPLSSDMREQLWNRTKGWEEGCGGVGGISLPCASLQCLFATFFGWNCTWMANAEHWDFALWTSHSSARSEHTTQQQRTGNACDSHRWVWLSSWSRALKSQWGPNWNGNYVLKVIIYTHSRLLPPEKLLASVCFCQLRNLQPVANRLRWGWEELKHRHGIALMM